VILTDQPAVTLSHPGKPTPRPSSGSKWAPDLTSAVGQAVIKVWIAERLERGIAAA
jgi:hypothetical protein